MKLACEPEHHAGCGLLLSWPDATTTDGPEHPGPRMNARAAAPGPQLGTSAWPCQAEQRLLSSLVLFFCFVFNFTQCCFHPPGTLSLACNTATSFEKPDNVRCVSWGCLKMRAESAIITHNFFVSKEVY